MMNKPAFAVASVLLALAAPAFAQPAVPKPPAEYDVLLRYEINAFRGEHVVQFDQLLNYLKSLGFKKVSEFEDERESRDRIHMEGIIASENARKLLNERHVKMLLLLPAGVKLFEDPKKPNPDQPLRVQLELGTVPDPARQRLLADQVRELLKQLGFREATAYDHRGHTQLAGMITAGPLLTTLINDLHKHPAGAKLPAPFQVVTPIRVIEVMAGMEPTVDRPPPPEVPKGTEKLAPDLRTLLDNKEEAAKPARM